MNCECNNNSNRVKPRIKHVYGNVLRMAIPLTLRTLVKDGDEMIVNDTDFIPSSDHPVRVVFSKGKTNYPVIATMDGNVAIIEDKGKIPVGTYDISVECYDDLGNPYRFKQNAVLYVADTTAEAGIDEEIEYEAQTWYLNAAVFLATTEIGEIGDVIDAKLDDVFGNVLYDANAKEIRFYNKGNSRVLATIDSRPFIVDGTVADVYIDVSRQVLVVVLNEDAGGRRFSVPLYLVFNSYYKKDEVDSLVSRTVEGVRFDFSQELPLVVPVTKNGSSISSPIDYGAIENAIREDGRLVVACVNNAKYYQLLAYIGMEVAFSRVVALDGYQELLIVNESNVWSMEDVELGTGGGGGGYEPPIGGIPKSDLAQSVQDTLDAVDGKVDKESGKSLMTDAERTKLQGIAAGAEVNVQSDWTQTITSADDYIKNKPTIPTKVSDLTNDSGFTSNAGTITGITMNGTSKGTSGVVDLGTVITAHQDISGKANASDVYTKTQTDTLLAGKQNTLTFDNAPTAGSNNAVKSGGVKQAIDDKLTEVTVNSIPAGSATLNAEEIDGTLYIYLEQADAVMSVIPSSLEITGNEQGRIVIIGRALTNPISIVASNGFSVDVSAITAADANGKKNIINVAYTGDEVSANGTIEVTSGSSVQVVSVSYGVALPNGYRLCDYINGGSGRYIMSGVYATSEIRIVTKLQNDIAGQYFGLFGVRDRNSSPDKRLEAYEYTGMAQSVAFKGCKFGTAYYTGSTDPHTIDLSKRRLVYDGVEYPNVNDADSVSWDSNLDIEIGGLNIGGNHRTPEVQMTVYKIFYFRIYDGTNLVRNYVAAYETASARYGLYDLVNNTFIASNGSNAFTGQIKQ